MRWMLVLCLLATLPLAAQEVVTLAEKSAHVTPGPITGPGSIGITVRTDHAGDWFVALEMTPPEHPELIGIPFSVDNAKTPVVHQPWDQACKPTFVLTGRGPWRQTLLLTPVTFPAGEHRFQLDVPPGSTVRGFTFYPALAATVVLNIPLERRVAFPGEKLSGTLTAKMAGRGTLYLDQLRLADGPEANWDRDARVVPIARRGEQAVWLTPGAAVNVSFPTDRYGLLGATLVLSDGERLWAGYLGAALVAPKRAMTLAPDGRCLVSAQPDTPPWKLALLKRAGVDWLRTEIGWSAFEPTKGVYDWHGLDPFFTACRADGLCVMNLASHAPRWAQPVGDFADVPYKDYTIKLDDAPGREFLPDWTRAWTAYLTRYRDVSRAVNLWNEPWEGGGISGWKSTGEHYRALLTGLKTARDAVDPAIKIVAPDSSSEADWKIFAAGKQDDIDVISTHYEWPKAATAYALAHYYHKEVWETETWEAWEGDAATVRRTLYNLALGAHVVSYWHRDNCLDPAGNPTPELTTLSAMQGMLAGTAFREIVHPERPPFVLLFTGKGRQVAAITTTLALDPTHADGDFRGQFADNHCTMELPDPFHRIRACDLYGNPLPVTRTWWKVRLPVGSDVRYLVYHGSAKRFKATLAKAIYPGLRPVEIVLHDILADRQEPEIRITLRNAYSVALPVTVSLDLPDAPHKSAIARFWAHLPAQQSFTAPARMTVTLPPAGEQTVAFTLLADYRAPAPGNRYHVTIHVQSPCGEASLEETLSVATITTIKQHDAFDETDRAWQRTTPVYLLPNHTRALPALTTWLPWPAFTKAVDESSAEVALATDADNLYLIARVKDGTPRMLPSVLSGKTPHVMQNAPADYMYREMAPWPERDGDSLELSLGRIDGNPWLPKYEVYPPTSPLYHLGAYVPARNVFLLYPTAEGGAEVLQLRAGDWYYAHPLPMDYAWMAEHCRVPGARVQARRDKDGYVLTAALPWASMPDVPHAPGSRLRLNLRLRDATPTAPLAWAGSPEAGGRQVLWSKGRSIAGRTPLDYVPCGREQWSADTEFGVE